MTKGMDIGRSDELRSLMQSIYYMRNYLDVMVASKSLTRKAIPEVTQKTHRS
jgi:hypothetical protein